MIILTALKLAASLLFYTVPAKMYEFQKLENPDKRSEKNSFAIAISKKNYVDKSLLIREFIRDKNRVILVTAPSGFGKSVNIDMLKSFFSIKLTNNSNEMENTTNIKNYKLFTHLKIFKEHRELFDLYFGRYPVIYIDYSSLAEINSYEDMVETFRLVLQKTYIQHAYLLGVGNLTKRKLANSVLDTDGFGDYIIPDRIKKLSKAALHDGFHSLCDVLFTHFRKKVIVLIDDYNAHVESLIFAEYKNTDDIYYFFETVNRQLFENEVVEKVLLSGVFSVKDTRLSSVITYYPFLRCHQYGQFYGITSPELEEILVKHTKGNRIEIITLKRKIKSYCNGYTILDKNLKIFNPYSLITYLELKSLEYNRKKRNYYANCSRLINNKDLIVNIITLLQNGTVVVNISDCLYKYDVIAVNKLISGPEKNSNSSKQLFFKLLFELGCFTSDSCNKSNLNALSVRLPNAEIQTEIAKSLKQAVVRQNKLNVQCSESVNDIINAITEYNNSEEIFKELHSKLSCVFYQSTYSPQNGNDFQSVLFSIFRDKFQHTYAGVRTTEEGELDIWLRNDYDFLYIIETKIVESKGSLRNCTQYITDHVLQKRYVDLLDLSFQKSVVYLGICYSRQDKLVGLGCSKPLNLNDGLYRNTFFVGM